MNRESRFNHTKIIRLKDVYDVIISKLFVIAIIGLVIFLGVFTKGAIMKKDIKSENPVYKSVLNINIDYDFLDTSILSVTKSVFNEDTFNRINEYEQLNISGKKLLNRVYYSAESKRNIYVTVYSADKESGIKTLHGIVNIAIPMMAKETNSKSITQNYVEKNSKVKIKPMKVQRKDGIIDVKDFTIVNWNEYINSTSTGLLLKNSLVLSFYGMFITIITILIYRFFSSRIFSISDIEVLTGKNVVAATSKTFEGTAFAAERIKAGIDSYKLKVGLLPTSNGKLNLETVNKIYNLDCDTFEKIDSLSKSPDLLLKFQNCDKVVLFCEHGKTNIIEICNTLDFLYDMHFENIDFVYTGVEIKKLKRKKEYFGKFYLNS